MIRIENVQVDGFRAALRGMRNPLNSWDRSDTVYGPDGLPQGGLGPNDEQLARRLILGGEPHRKFLRMINVSMDLTAMQPWWSEFDTYKVGTVRNSCSKMHKIHAYEFTPDHFEHSAIDEVPYAGEAMEALLPVLNRLREDFNTTKEKRYWRALIELLPEGYLLRATVQVNYEVLRTMYRWRKNHKLQEWRDLCARMETFPEAWMIVEANEEPAER